MNFIAANQSLGKKNPLEVADSSYPKGIRPIYVNFTEISAENSHNPPFKMSVHGSKWYNCDSYYDHFEKLGYYRNKEPYAAFANIFSTLPGHVYGTVLDKHIPLICKDFGGGYDVLIFFLPEEPMDLYFYGNHPRIINK